MIKYGPLQEALEDDLYEGKIEYGVIAYVEWLEKKSEAFDLLVDALKDEIEMYEVSPGQTRLEINSLGYDMTNEEAKILMEVMKND